MFQSIYCVYNYDLKEAHYGSTSNRVRDRFKELRAGKQQRISHWQWGTHDIDCQPLEKNVLMPIVAFRVHELKKNFLRSKPDWKVI
ncbi:MAG TPA: hypothetical protein VF681_06460 [Abditibacteriaceae bacterium]